MLIINFSYHSHTQQFIANLLYLAVNKITYSLIWALAAEVIFTSAM